MSSPSEIHVPAPDRDLLRPPPPVRLVPVPPAVAGPTAALFGTLSRLRGRRAMHPVGVVTAARLRVPEDTSLPAAWRSLDGAEAIVRFSKAIGLPGRIPDVLGIALRVGGQDLLLATVAGGAPALQHVLWPAAGFDGATFSSLLAHRVGDRLEILQARLRGRLPDADSYLDAVRDAGTITVDVLAAGLGGGRRPIGMVQTTGVVEGPEAARVRFDPWRTGGGIRPAGPVQRLRAAAYAASRRATSR